jgi:hypothetical protein
VAAGLAAAAAQFSGQVVPGDAGLEDEEDASEGLAVVQPLAAGARVGASDGLAGAVTVLAVSASPQ